MSHDIHQQLGRIRKYADEKAGDTANRLKNKTSQATEHMELARERAAAAYARSRKSASKTYDSARDTTNRAATAAGRFVADHPLAVTAGAIAAGALISLLFPKGRAAASALGVKAFAAAKAAKEAVEESETAEVVRAKAAEATSIARARAAEALTSARTAIVDADIPATVKARAAEAAEAARDAIERARLPERATKLAGQAATRAGEALVATGKAVSARAPS
jgi:ElaB/YqjD/DUF883 family membrane-anchored ribosome-binding protein